MAEPAHAHTGPSDDSPCYNCGAKGHWVVACPEPTRKTPAGLANAWRNGPNAPNAGHGNHRQHHGGNQKRINKGPIITKYAPPPPPPPPPSPHPSSLNHGTASYPLLPPGPPYPQQNPQFQSPYAHYQPAAHYSAGYGPTYPPQQYHQPPYGAAPAAPAGYPAHPPGPPAPQPPTPYPAVYASYPPAGPSSTPGYPPQTTYAQSYSQPPYGLPPVPYPAQSGPAHFPPPPKPPHVSRPHSGLNQPVHHSLPPKPPRSVHTQQEQPQRDHRNRRKNDRQNKHRDNRRRDQGSRHRSSQQKMQNKANRSNRGNRSNRSSSAIRSSQKASALTIAENTKAGPLSSVEDLEKNTELGSEASKDGFYEDSAATEIPVLDNAQSYQHEDDQSRQSIAGELEEDSETADSESGESTDGNEPQPARAVLPDDKAEVARDDERLSQNTHHPGKDEASTPSSIAPDMPHLNGKHKRRDDESEDEPQPKKSKAAASLAHDPKDAEEGDQTQAQHDTGSVVQGDDAPTVDEEDEPVLPTLEPESRSRSKERHQGPKSRNSSVSSRSSDLNSLEAELLGRPAKQRSPDDIGVHQRQDRVTLPKMQRRRQQNADSAYGRRW